MLSGDDIRKLGMVLVAIPKEMFWAYESVRQSGHYNMAGIRFPLAEVNTEEMIRVMNECYIEYLIRGNVDLEKEPKPKLTRDHILFIQLCYQQCLDSYSLPEHLLEIKREVKVQTEIGIK